MFKLVIVILFFESGFCEIFDISDVYDPLSFFWPKAVYNINNKCIQTNKNEDVVGECLSPSKCLLYGGTVGGFCADSSICCTFPPKTKECKVTTVGVEEEGLCMSGKKCHKQGGSAKGSCGFFEKCCIYDNSCGRLSTAKVSYFERKVGKVEDDLTSCVYTVYVNPNVCQVRLDFETFRIAPASFDSTTSQIKCSVDALNIEPNNYGIPTICGPNDNNHVYVHLQPGDDKVTLRMKLSKRTVDDTSELPYWRIKVTQLHCTGSTKKYDTSHHDFPLLAPRGAIQYYTETTGYFRSFGYSKSYTTDEFYSIAFKKDPGYCGAKFIFTSVNMLMDAAGTNDAACLDYFSVPGLVAPTLPSNVAKMCMNAAEFKSIVPGPLYLTFSSLLVNAKPHMDVDYFYKVQYEMLSSCS